MSDWIPLLQTLIWAGLISVILYMGRGNWGRIIRALERRIGQGDDLSVRGPLGLSAELKRASSGLPRLEPGDDEGAASATDKSSGDLAALRSNQGAQQRGVHLVHVVAPSDRPGQKYDIYAYLHGWGRTRFQLPEDLSDVVSAEFFVGPLFTPSTVKVQNKGMDASASLRRHTRRPCVFAG